MDAPAEITGDRGLILPSNLDSADRFRMLKSKLVGQYGQTKNETTSFDNRKKSVTPYASPKPDLPVEPKIPPLTETKIKKRR